MVGLQVAREAARELNPKKIVIASLREAEVRDAIAFLGPEVGEEKLEGEWGDIFHPEQFKNRRRADLVADREAYDELFREVFSPKADHTKSALYQLIERHQPDVVVDCINTATGISYQDEFKLAQETYELLRDVEDGNGERLPQLLQKTRELLIAQGVPQIARHILILHRSLESSSVRVYVKVGTTGTGGMGINIPYTHSEDKPSMQLLAKSAIGFAHTGLLFLLARTPSGSATTPSGLCSDSSATPSRAARSFPRSPSATSGRRSCRSCWPRRI